MRIARSRVSLLATTTPLLLSSISVSPTVFASQSTFNLKSFSTMSGNDDSAQLSTQNEQIIKDAQDLFSAKPTPEIFRRSWSPNAIFQDPICYAVGSRQFLAQWYGMPAAFSKSETLAWRVESSNDREIVYHQRQLYKIKGLGVEKEMVSKVVIGLDQKGRIESFEDRWNGDELPNGYLAMFFRKANARFLPYIISVPKETSEIMASASASGSDSNSKKDPNDL